MKKIIIVNQPSEAPKEAKGVCRIGDKWAVIYDKYEVCGLKNWDPAISLEEMMDREEVSSGIFEKAYDTIIRNFSTVGYLSGKLTEIYPELSRVFESLPPTEVLIEGLSQFDHRALLQWHEEVKEKAKYWGDGSYASMELFADHVEFITPTSERIVRIEKYGDFKVSVEFGMSYTAAGAVIGGIRKNHPETSVIFRGSHSEDTCNVKDIVLDGDDIHLEYDVMRAHAPSWFINYLEYLEENYETDKYEIVSGPSFAYK